MRRKSHVAPVHLSERSKVLWNALVPTRAQSPGRLELLRSALFDLDLMDEARERLRTEGHTWTTKTTGAVHVNPMHHVLRDAHARFVATWRELKFEFDPEEDPE